MIRAFLLLVLLSGSLLFSCSSKKETSDLNIAITSFPDSFNPVMSSGNQSLEVNRLVYEFLQKIDTNGVPRAILVENLTQDVLNDTLSAIYADIAGAARWAGGRPVSTYDVGLSVKLRKTPLINSGSPFDLYPIVSGKFDSLTSPAMQLLLRGNPQYARIISGDYMVIPEHIFDSAHIFRKYDIEYLATLTASTAPRELLEYARKFNEIPPYDPIFFEGSGPYRIEKMVPGQSISLGLRSDWWAEAQAEVVLPEKINFVVIPDATAARFALQNGQIDLMTQVPATEFVQLEEFNKSSNTLNLYKQAGFRFVFVGFNTRLSKFSDRRTRQALAHLIDVPSIIAAVKLGYADQTVGPVHPVLKDLYNDSLKIFNYDTTTASSLLRDAGWQYKENQWANARGETLNFSIRYNGANKDYEKIALIVKEEAARMGIDVAIVQEEGSQLNRKLRSHQFEATFWSFIGSPTAFDFTPLFHTDAAAPGNLNFTGFGNGRSDEAIEKALLARSRTDMGNHLKDLQKEIRLECPMVFLYYEQSLIAASKEFPRLNITYYKPGYDPVGTFDEE